jgi:polyphosphate kinase
MLGRFLEHERVFVFGDDGEEEIFLASADWMPRNLDRRVELLFPIASEAIRRQVLEECVWPFGNEHCRAYEMRADGSYERPPSDSEEPIPDVQEYVMSQAARSRPRPSLKPWDAIS